MDHRESETGQLFAARRVATTALVLSGGASFGALQVGMLRELLAFGVRPDLIVGTSVGAINGAHLAGNPSLEGIEQLTTIWRSLQRRRILPFSLGGFLRGLCSGDSVVDPSALRALLRQTLPFADLASARVPLHVMATDLASGLPVRLSTGPAVDAVLASSAIPGLLPPVRIADRVLMDGAVSSNTPVREAALLGANRIIVLPAWPVGGKVATPRGAFGHGLHALGLMMSRQLSDDLRFSAERAEVFTVPAVDPGPLSPLDFSRSDALIEQSADRTREWLRSGGLWARETRSAIPNLRSSNRETSRPPFRFPLPLPTARATAA